LIDFDQKSNDILHEVNAIFEKVTIFGLGKLEKISRVSQKA
jgi:hypothetical protein